MTLTTAEVAAQLGITPRRVRALIVAGRLPARKVGRDWLLTARAVAAFVPAPRGRPKR